MPKSRRDPLPAFLKTQVGLLVLPGSTVKELEVQVGRFDFKDIYDCWKN